MFIFKIAGAMAERGDSLESIVKATRDNLIISIHDYIYDLYFT